MGDWEKTFDISAVAHDSLYTGNSFGVGTCMVRANLLKAVAASPGRLRCAGVLIVVC